MRNRIVLLSLLFLFSLLLFLQPEKEFDNRIQEREQEITSQIQELKSTVKRHIPQRAPASVDEGIIKGRYLSSYTPLQEKIDRFKFEEKDLKKINGESLFLKESYQMVPLIEDIPRSGKILKDDFMKRMGFQLVKNESTSQKGFGTQYMGVRKNSGKQVVITGDLLIEYRDRSQAAEDLSLFENLRYKPGQDINPIMPFMVFQVSDLPNNLDICIELKKVDSVKNCSFEVISGRVVSN